jgi:hypothetical protein
VHHPQRAAETSPRYIQELPKPRKEMQPTFDRLLHPLDPESAVCIKKAAAVQDAQGADVPAATLRPATRSAGLLRSAAPPTTPDDHACIPGTQLEPFDSPTSDRLLDSVAQPDYVVTDGFVGHESQCG